MQTTTRREFLKQTGKVTVTGAALAVGPSLGVAGANDKLVLGVIGPGGMGTHLLDSFVRQPDVEIAWVCDPDRQRLDKARATVERVGGKAPRADKDLRRVLEDKSVDVVIIATPDHWHAPATILACQAGKHVYVEKPCAHNIREGRLMVEAARRHRRVVQVGTQTRSTEHALQAVKRLREGAIGEVLVAKAWNSQLRRS